MNRRRARWGLLAFGTVAYAGLLFSWFSLAAYLSTVEAALGLTKTEVGLLTGAIPLTYVPVSLFSGPLTDRVGPYRGVAAGAATVGVAQLGRSAATGFPAMLAFTVLLGAGGTAITFGLPKLVSELFPASEAGAPSTVYVLGSLSGTAAAFALGRPVVGPALGGWRPLFGATGLALLVYAAAWAATALAVPVDELRVEDGDGERVPARRALRRVAASPAMRALLVVGFVYLLVVHGTQNWLATVLESRGLDAALAASATGGFVAAQAAGTLVVPAVSDRLGRRGGAVAACGAGCALGTAALLVPPLPLAVPVAGALLAGFGVGGLSPLVRIVPAELDDVGPALTGTAVGAVFAVGEVGGFLGPFLVGALHDLTGSYVPGFALVSAGAVAAVVAGRRLPV